MSTKYIRVVSDLHLEQYNGRDIDVLLLEMIPEDPRDAESILVLAGDISSVPDQLVPFVMKAELRFAAVVYVPGNHEYYKHDMTPWNLTMRDRFGEWTSKTSYALGEVLVQQIEGVRFIFGTLWGDGGSTLEEQAKVGFYLNDFRLSLIDGRRYTVKDMQRLHHEHKSKITSALVNEQSMPTVVVTHHMPSYELCHPRFGNDANGGFASKCDMLMSASFAPNVWIHGHTHDTIDRVIGKTRVVCNPRGYHAEFRADVGHNFNAYKVEPKFIAIEDL